jgi:RND family efflux transporter MFP subunit
MKIYKHEKNMDRKGWVLAMSEKWLRFGYAAALAAISVLCVACSPEATETPGPPAAIEVKTQAAAAGDLEVEGIYIGTVAHEESVYVYPQISGTVTNTHYEQGETVSEGDVLFEIDAELLSVQVEQAQAAVDAAAANTISEISLADAKRRLEQTKLLFEEGAVSQQDLDQAESAYESALSQHNAAQVGARQAQIPLKSAEIQYGYTQVRAPISGTVEQKNVSVHEMASPQKYAYVIASQSEMKVSFLVPEHTAKILGVGDAIKMEEEGSIYAGRIVEVPKASDPASGLFKIQAVLEGNGSFYDGEIVNIHATAQRAVDATLIPVSAIFYESGDAFVYLAENGKARKSTIEIGVFNDEFAEITAGAKAGERVITTWNRSLADGAAVEEAP